jgi:3-dehydroquinate dehydratase type I
MIRICASITENNTEKCIKEISKAKKQGASLAEIRMDFLDRCKEISKIIDESKMPLIVTNRNEKVGGKFKGSEEERISNLLNAIDAGCEFVDIELNTDEKLRGIVIKLAKRNKCKTIVSVHDFKRTPDLKILNNLLNEERKIAEIGKIVTFGNKIEDTIKIFNLLRITNSLKFPLITFVMGSLCGFSRIVSPLIGSYLTYASIEKPSAPGQLSVKEMVDVYKKLGVKV